MDYLLNNKLKIKIMEPTKYNSVIVKTYELDNGEIFTKWDTVEQEELYQKYKEYNKKYPYCEAIVGKNRKPTFEEFINNLK